VRLALGASAADVRALVVREVVRVALPGVALGVVGAIVASQALRTLLFGVSATDPAVFLIAAVALGLAAVAAAEGPVRRATKVDPIIVLRTE
jgi:ABC-type antimicrobial peptide transport system permease subunit